MIFLLFIILLKYLTWNIQEENVCLLASVLKMGQLDVSGGSQKPVVFTDPEVIKYIYHIVFCLERIQFLTNFEKSNANANTKL